MLFYTLRGADLTLYPLSHRRGAAHEQSGAGGRLALPLALLSHRRGVGGVARPRPISAHPVLSALLCKTTGVCGEACAVE